MKLVLVKVKLILGPEEIPCPWRGGIGNKRAAAAEIEMGRLRCRCYCCRRHSYGPSPGMSKAAQNKYACKSVCCSLGYRLCARGIDVQGRLYRWCYSAKVSRTRHIRRESHCALDGELVGVANDQMVSGSPAEVKFVAGCVFP